MYKKPRESNFSYQRLLMPCQCHGAITKSLAYSANTKTKILKVPEVADHLKKTNMKKKVYCASSSGQECQVNLSS